MLKKVIVGILCLIILAFTGVGIYVYTLDWNKHKSTVSQRLSKITGLNAVIDGNLKIDFFPTPRVTAGKVKFYKTAARTNPLVLINEINANVEFLPLLDNKFVITSMTLNNAMINVVIDEKGELNWSGVKNQGVRKSGNVEASFSDVKLSNSTVNYENLKNKKEIKIPNISATVSAPSLAGPYKADGKFIHNGAEIKFSGNITNDAKTKINMGISNLLTSSKIHIEGTVGSDAEGIFSVDTKNLYELTNIVFGKDSINSIYSSPAYFSFKYKNIGEVFNLDDFTVKYGNYTVGTGKVNVNFSEEPQRIIADFNMNKFDLDIIKNICDDYISFIKKGKKFENIPYATEISLKAQDALVNNVVANDLSLALAVDKGILSISRFGLNLNGDSSIKMVGKVDIDTLQYVFSQSVKTADLRLLSSVFNINLSKLASDENKNSIFNKASAEMEVSGDLNNIKVSLLNAEIDAIKFNGDIGYVIRDGKDLLALDINTSKIIFDRYIDILPQNMLNASLKDKFIYQLKLIPLTNQVDIDATINIDSAVYNKIPLEKINLQALLTDNTLNVKKFDVKNIAGADLSLSFDASDVFNSPYFDELSYTLKSSDFPLFATTLGIDTGNKLLFNNKLVASQGIMTGSFDDYKLSLLQKFGNTEFSYNGNVKKNEQNIFTVDGDIELKTNNFAKFIKAIGLDYNPNIALTSFTLNGKLSGIKDKFELSDIDSYLGANNIKGKLFVDNTSSKPLIIADLTFDSFEINRWFDINTKFANYKDSTDVTFIKKPLFIDDKIDYSKLSTLNFDVKATAKKAYYNKEVYSNAIIVTNLKDGILNVSSFSAHNENTDININFVLDSNNIPKIYGNYDLKNINIPYLGGKVYAIGNSKLDAKGNFNSIASSKKEFFDNLDAEGKFSTSNLTIQGFDLDIIKFELEQSKTIDQLNNKIENSLKSGKSNFSSIYGDFNVHKGIVIANKVILSSPIADIDMDLDFNLNNWSISSNFDILYRNVSFYDVVKFKLFGSLENPSIEVDIDDSIKRIGDAENRVKKAFADEEKEKSERIAKRLDNLNANINNALSKISRISLDVVRYTPVSSNENVRETFDINVKTLHDVENAIKNMSLRLSKMPNEELLMNIDAEFWAEEAKLKFISKTLEDNFIVDSKYVFDDIFNKIVWIYNVAQNNVAYYNTVSDAYMGMAKKLDDNCSLEKLQQSKDTVEEDMNKINNIQEKIRDNYLYIIDSSRVSEMNNNIDVAKQALQTILTYTKELNNDIITSIDLFRSNLNINERNYDEFLVYPPLSISDIDIKQPTSKNTNDPLKGILTPTAPKKEDVEEKISFNLDNIKNGLGSLIDKFNADNRAKKEKSLVSEMAFNGLSSIIKHNENPAEVQNNLNLDISIADLNSNIDLSNVQLADISDVVKTIDLAENTLKLNNTNSIINDQTIAEDEPAQKEEIIVDNTESAQLKKEIPSINRDEIPSIVKSLSVEDNKVFIAEATPLNTIASYYNRLDDSNYNTKSLINDFNKAEILDLNFEKSRKNNQYLFYANNNSSIKTYGTIGKLMLKDKIVENTDQRCPNKYIFASNDNISVPFIGTINKVSGISVK